MSYSNIRSRLRDGEAVEFNGTILRMIPGKEEGSKFEVGDTYFAERNAGPKLLTVAKVVDAAYAKENGLRFSGWIQPVEIAYSYDFWECVAVTVERPEVV